MTESLLMAAVSESNDNKNCSSRLLTFIFILLRSLIINGRVVKLCGAIGVITKQLLSGVIMGPPQLKLYPVLPVGVDIMIPSAQYVARYSLLMYVSTVIIAVEFFRATVISFKAKFTLNLDVASSG